MFWRLRRSALELFRGVMGMYVATATQSGVKDSGENSCRASLHRYRGLCLSGVEECVILEQEASRTRFAAHRGHHSSGTENL